MKIRLRAAPVMAAAGATMPLLTAGEVAGHASPAQRLSDYGQLLKPLKEKSS